MSNFDNLKIKKRNIQKISFKELSIIKNFIFWVDSISCEQTNKNAIFVRPFDDKNAIPLCYKHHAELHDKIGDEHKFFMKYNLPSYYGELVAVWFWYMSPHRSI